MVSVAVRQGVAGVVVSKVQKAPWVAEEAEEASAFSEMVEVARMLQLVLLGWCKQKKLY